MAPDGCCSEICAMDVAGRFDRAFLSDQVPVNDSCGMHGDWLARVQVALTSSLRPR